MKVFLSSTAEGLTEYRRVAKEVIVKASHQVVALEHFGSLEIVKRFSALLGISLANLCLGRALLGYHRRDREVQELEALLA